MLRPVFATLSMMLSVFLTGPTMAQGQFDGTWSFVPNGFAVPLMIIELDESTGILHGAGLIPEGNGEIQAGTVSVTAGASLDTALQIELNLQPQGATALLTAIDGQSATLMIGGTTVQGALVRFGSSTTASAAPTETEDTPGDTCTSMMALQQVVILNADERQREAIERIYTDADSRFGQEPTESRCAHLLLELSRLQSEELTTTTTTTVAAPQAGFGNACDDVDGLVQSIYAELEAFGHSDDGTVQALLDESGLGTDGIWSTGACEYGIANLRDFLGAIGTGTDEVMGQSTPVKDPSGSVPAVQTIDLRDLGFQVIDVSDHLNMRAGPGTGFGVVYQLPYFARDLRIIGQGCTANMVEAGFGDLPLGGQIAELQSRWCEVDWNGTQGWVSGRYLRPM